MKKQDRLSAVIDYFQREMPDAQSELHFDSTYQLLVAVMLSAQCTDKRVNMVTPSLFAAYPTPESMATADETEVQTYISSISYPHSKANHLVGMSRMLVADFNGQVPSSMDDLLKLPGVGRKTANVILSIAYGESTMAVDTHVFRVSHRIGMVSKRCTTPFSVEKELTKMFPPELIPLAHHWLLLHGRYVCKASKPSCDKCGIRQFCKNNESAKERGQDNETTRKQEQ
jgi:endonuclease III